jgi:hypothetical protein
MFRPHSDHQGTLRFSLGDKSMNFFSWVRDSVRQAVLLGVSDAVGDIGTPPEGDDIRQRLLQTLRNGQPAITEARSSERVARKKLGRSLEQIQATAKTS